MGRVIEAEDVNLGRRVALKLLNANKTTMLNADSLRHEASLVASIRHPSVVTVYSYGVHDGAPFITMELVEGTNLQSVIDEHSAHNSRVPLGRAWTIIQRIGEGLQAAHEAGVVHRDVKPSNVMIENRSGRPVLIDFGIAVRGRQGGTEIAGTPQFMAPEDFFGVDETIGPTSDHYAFASTVYELFSGRPAFDELPLPQLVQMKSRGAYTPFASIDSTLGPLDAVMSKALSGAMSDRFTSIRDFVAALEGALRTIEQSRITLDRVQRTSVPQADVLQILAIDDDDAFRKLAMRAAQIAFFGKKANTRGTATGDEALESTPRAPDLLMLDFDLPGLDGIETLTRLRNRPNGDKMRVVVVSGRAGERERWRFGVLGVQDFLKKPVEFGMMVQVLSDLAKAQGWISDVPMSAENSEG